ncbi:hypothetical protein ACWOC1_04580 [Enterococcus quebecensis]|uniref:DUF5067 domain-containing protein n=1 Tax=Enterococcus quebecensis TaxID=903983 RepID=A0A1E5GWQ7_9ENTE|nr:hypothetical protein [Enterococcus quebecensis]OEG17097.1 hypothetical protein BCR23_03580 [Enterococcus quebecensis]
MKKKLLVGSCLVAFGLVVAPKAVSATERETLPPTGIRPRVSVLKQEITLKSGDIQRIYFDGIVDKENFASKLLVKIKPQNPENDYFGVSHYVYTNDILLNDFVSNTNSIFEYKWSPMTDESYKDKVKYGARQYISINNYSLVPIKFTIGYTTGIHMKSNPCLDYSDINFNL